MQGRKCVRVFEFKCVQVLTLVLRTPPPMLWPQAAAGSRPAPHSECSAPRPPRWPNPAGREERRGGRYRKQEVSESFWFMSTCVSRGLRAAPAFPWDFLNPAHLSTGLFYRIKPNAYRDKLGEAFSSWQRASTGHALPGRHPLTLKSSYCEATVSPRRQMHAPLTNFLQLCLQKPNIF